ncbi:Ubiquitin carboxyl-terminal hydrolase 48 [Podila humilis]|nr:Ubiquitin carboxyl-terminal hydrolase 48 [Podila humilis]
MKRRPGAPAGMTNLGATCYANSLLQVWYQDVKFRNAIYLSEFEPTGEKSMDALYQLQLLFTYLDRGAKNVYNPLALVTSLKLDTTIQQDAQEYFCSTCDSLQEARREIKIERMPEVLNVQLMRFVYDTVTWTKKKSKDTIRFPELIDFASLLRSKEPVVYELNAVLVHSGSNAHSGHFLAHVLDKHAKKWFVLNDEECAEFDSTLFDPEDYSEASKTSKEKKSSKTTMVSGADDNSRMLKYISCCDIVLDDIVN